MGLTAVQFFSRNPRGWKGRTVSQEEIDQFRRLSASSDIITTVIHTNYLINIASPDKEIWRKSYQVLIEELAVAERLGVDYVVTHLGSHKGRGRELGLSNVVKAVKRALGEVEPTGGGKPVLLMENSAGAGNLVGNRFGELAEIMDEVAKGGCLQECLGICIDSAHAFAEGYDVRNAEGRKEIFDQLGEYADRILLIHLNDSKTDLASHHDRHQHLGKGLIGEEGLSSFLHDGNLSTQPVIMETPIDEGDGDEDNLEVFLRLEKG